MKFHRSKVDEFLFWFTIIFCLVGFVLVGYAIGSGK